MKHWQVGDTKWRDDGTALIQIARTKTAARQLAERLLAKAETDQSLQQLQKMHATDVRRKSWPFDEYVRWVAGIRCPIAVSAQAYLKLQEGIWLTGPKGERVHVIGPSQKARRDRRRTLQRSEGMILSLVKRAGD